MVSYNIVGIENTINIKDRRVLILHQRCFVYVTNNSSLFQSLKVVHFGGSASTLFYLTKNENISQKNYIWDFIFLLC